MHKASESGHLESITEIDKINTPIEPQNQEELTEEFKSIKLAEFTDMIMQAIEDGDTRRLNEVLVILPSYICISEIVDHLGYTVIHKAARLDEKKAFAILLNRGLHDLSASEIKKWLNARTKSE